MWLLLMAVKCSMCVGSRKLFDWKIHKELNLLPRVNDEQMRKRLQLGK